ncbi:phosphoribosyltransferase [Dehalogenimonas etheniformans]|uniref:Phosphoribosyltransferase n=1 Tax=Dehalogenimonas etheniformans TaxID=1536648 RepID=A0A2P5P5Y3_9CHLR|nr:phosphoribosyltransferase family protein [Dehalogenimonas etheniformans]PPD57721.1 phosphoribosyltransferase [Dehalogenimonas etheniformans]QNT76061.1 phosphoribosyltransferase [Dehalogenimonas etheniformans]
MANWRILSRNGEPFADRTEAGNLLAAELKDYAGRNTVVLGIPRGGMAVARQIALQLDAKLDIVLSRKLRSPGQPELAFGAISEDDQVSLNQDVVRMLDISEDFIEREKAFQMAEIKRRNRVFREVSPRVPLNGMIAIITDDGVATGATFKVALAAARHEKPGKLIAALPVGPEDTIKSLARDADELVCLRSPADFGAVGQFYRRFEQLDDADVLDILRQDRDRLVKPSRL